MDVFINLMGILSQCIHGGSDGKESACNAGDPGSIPGSRRSPGGGNGYPLQYSSLESSVDRGAQRAIVHGVSKESEVTEQLNLLLFFIFISNVKYIWIKVGYGVDSSHVSQLLKFLFILPQVLYSPPALVNPRSFFTTKNWLLSKCLIHATCYFMRRLPCVWKTNSRNKYIWELVCVQAMLGLPRWLSR